MDSPTHQLDHVLGKLQGLAPHRLLEVEDFIDFLKQRDDERSFTQAVQAASEPVLDQIWNNPDDAEYDQL
jgi:hypothetical protein